MVDPVVAPTLLSQLGSAGSFLSGLGSFGSAIGSMFGGGGSSSKRWTNHWNTVAMNMENDRLHNSVAYRVADAKRAGIHPLAAMGMSPSSGGSPGFNVSVGGGRDFGAAMKEMGAGLSRAAGATQTNLERLQERLLLSQVEGQEIDNAYKASEISRLQRSAQLPPPMPLPNPTEFYRNKGQAKSSVQKFSQGDGSIVEWPSDAAKQAIEDSPYEWEHMYRNRILPWLSNGFYDYVYEPVSRVKSRLLRDTFYFRNQ